MKKILALLACMLVSTQATAMLQALRAKITKFKPQIKIGAVASTTGFLGYKYGIYTSNINKEQKHTDTKSMPDSITTLHYHPTQVVKEPVRWHKSPQK